MADQKVSDLPALIGANVAPGDLLYIVDSLIHPLVQQDRKKSPLASINLRHMTQQQQPRLVILTRQKP